jgi:N-acetyl sugar amidotransferase
MTTSLKVCNRCVMDSSISAITFNQEGICNYCTDQLNLISNQQLMNLNDSDRLNRLIEKIKDKSKHRRYDVLVGVSGGIDSAYGLHLSAKLGLRVLAVHIDAGWNTETAVSNIEKLCIKLNIDLVTHVVDWNAMREIQRAFIFSGTLNLDIPQDHVFLSGVYKIAKKYRIKYIFNGVNVFTEGISPNMSQGYTPLDWKFIKSIYKTHGRIYKIKNFPKMSFVELIINNFVYRKVKLLNYINYSQNDAIRILRNEYEWEYYGGKHFESRFTKFFQSSYLTERFSYDKRKLHLSSLIMNGEISRESAIEKLDNPPYDQVSMTEDKIYILKKLDIALNEYDQIIASPIRPYKDYKNNEFFIFLVFDFYKLLLNSRTLTRIRKLVSR